MADTHAQLTTQLAAMLRTLGRTVRDHLNESLVSAELTPPQAWALHALEESCHMGVLADRLGFDKSYVTAIADGLEKMGLVERVPDQNDRRVRNLVLTDAGIAMRRSIELRMLDGFPIGQNLTEDEMRALIALLEKSLPN